MADFQDALAQSCQQRMTIQSDFTGKKFRFCSLLEKSERKWGNLNRSIV